MQGTILRSQLRTNTPGHTAIVGEVSYASGVPAVLTGSRFTVGRGVLTLTVATTPTIVGAPAGTYVGVPVTTASGTTALCSLVINSSAVVTSAVVTAPGYDYTAATTMSVAVGSLFWLASSLAATTATAGTYYVPLALGGGTGMVAKVVTDGTNITAVTVNAALDALTSVGVNYGTSAITVSLAAGALYAGSPAVASAFTLTPNPVLTVGTITTVITGNCSIIFANKVKNVVSAVATPIVLQTGNTFFTMSKRFDGPSYVNFSTLGTSNATATPSDNDGFCFNLVATDTSVTA